MKKAAALVLLAAVAASPAGAQTQTAGGNAQRGREIAERLCATCHAVSASPSATVSADVPPFAAIARRPDATAERLAGRIIIPHPAMPAMQLTVAEIRDVIAYILSLKTSGQ